MCALRPSPRNGVPFQKAPNPTRRLLLGWSSFLIYGTILLRASKLRKTGSILITLFFLPIAFIVFVGWFMDYEYLSCMLNGTSETIDYCRSL